MLEVTRSKPVAWMSRSYKSNIYSILSAEKGLRSDRFCPSAGRGLTKIIGAEKLDNRRREATGEANHDRSALEPVVLLKGEGGQDRDLVPVAAVERGG
jgi:hypothetical protein